MARKTKRKKTKAPPPAAQRLVASIDVFESDIVISRYTGKCVERRFASAGDVAAMFASASAARVAWWPTSPQVIAVGLDPDGQQHWLVYRKAAAATLAVLFGKRPRRVTVKMPAMIAEMCGRCSADRVTWKALRRVYVVAPGPLATTSTLYACPTPNVAAGKASMCLVKMDRLAGQPPHEAFENAFFNSVFTESSMGASLSDAGKKIWRSSWHMLSDCAKTRRPISLKWLKRQGTFGDVFGGAKGRKS